MKFESESTINFKIINNGTENEMLLFEIECINEKVAFDFYKCMFELYEEVICTICNEIIKGQVLTETYLEWWKEEIAWRIVEVE